MSSARVLLAVVAAGVLALSGCSGVDADAPLSEVSETEQAKQAGREATKGIFVDSEIDCIYDKLFARSDLTPRQIKDYAKEPVQSGPVAAAYQEIVPGCLDRNASVPAVPLSDELRTGFLNGIKSGAPGVTDAQAACLLDGVLARGVTGRDLALSGYDQEILETKVAPAVGEVQKTCP